MEITLSGGGMGPMVTGRRDGRTVSLTWPGPLPTPGVDGAAATYAEVLPGGLWTLILAPPIIASIPR